MLKYIILLCFVASAAGKARQTFYITNPKTGKVLEATGECKDSENNVKISAKKAGKAQQLWYKGPKKNSIVNMGQCGKILDLDFGKCEDGRNIKTWKKTNRGSQQFQFSGATGIIYNSGMYIKLLLQ